MPSEKNIKCRAFSGILYPDDPGFDNSYTRLKEMDSVFILHHSDVDEIGEIKKPHYHFIVKFDNPVYRNSVADQIGIKKEYILPITKDWKDENGKSVRVINYFRTLKDAELYLVHGSFKDRDKYQYSITELFCGKNKNSLLHTLETIRGRELSGSEKAKLLYEFVRSSNSYISKFKFLDYASKNDCFTYASSKWFFWSDIITEHNMNYSNN